MPARAMTPAVRILLWHGYLLGGTGSNVYTRQLAREWVAGRPRRRRPLPGAAPGGVRPRRRRRRATRRRRVAARVRPRSLRGVRGAAAPGLHARPSSTAGWTANAAAVREHLPADLVFCNHVLLGGPVGAATGARYRRQGARLGARVLDARQRRALEPGERGACARPRRRSSAPRTSARCSRTSSATSSASTRSRPGVDVEEWAPEERDEALAALLAEARRDPPNPGTRTSGCPTTATHSGWSGFSRATADRRLLRQAARTTRASTCCSTRSAGWTRVR